MQPTTALELLDWASDHLSAITTAADGDTDAALVLALIDRGTRLSQPEMTDLLAAIGRLKESGVGDAIL